MGQTCILTGMILNVSPAGEYDKRITLLTKERGKITGFVRGARRPKSSMQAATNLFCFGTFEAYEGRDAYTIVKAEVTNYFRELSTDLDMNFYGCYFLEVADYFTPLHTEGVNQLKLLYQTLRALSVKSLDHRLVRAIYELKSLVYYGVYPNVFSCIKCGTKENLHHFHVGKRGVLCDDCVRGEHARPVGDSLLYAMQYIVSSSIEKLYTFTLSEEVMDELCYLVRSYMKLYVDREFKTLQFLEYML